MRVPHLDPSFFATDTTLSERVIRRPSPPARFAGTHPLIIPLADSRLNLADQDTLVVTLENLAPTQVCVGLRLIHAGNPAPVSVTGGREWLEPGGPADLFFPVESFGSHGHPDGWQRVRSIELIVRRERDRSEPTRLDIAVHALRSRKRIRPTGPRLTRAGLRSVREGDLADFRKDTAFSREPDRAVLAIPPPIFSYRRDIPAEVLAGRIMGRRVGFPPDWSADPFGELEWRHFLHRHHFLRPLTRALVRTGQEQYAQALKAALVDWIKSNPVPLESDGGAGPAWETLSVAFRLREWLAILGPIGNRPCFDAETRNLILASIWEQARHLRDHRGHPGNWRLLEAAALALTGLGWPLFREAEEWASEGLARLAREVAEQFLADGLHFEVSPLYHGLCSQACLEVREAARRSGRPLPESLRNGPAHWFKALAALYRPDFTRPSINDSGGIADHDRALLAWAGTVLEPPEILWRGSSGRRGHPPAERNQLFPDAGLAVLRSGYGPHDLQVLFRAGRPQDGPVRPGGPGHTHGDRLSLEFTAQGRTLLVDPGIGRYAPGPMTEAYRQPEAHCVILVHRDGEEPKPSGGIGPETPPSRIRLLERPGLDVVWADTGQNGVSVTRAVVLLAKKFVVVRDHVDGSGRGEIRVHWQFAPARIPEKILRLVSWSGRGLPRVESHQGRTCPPAGFVAVGGRNVPAPRWDYLFAADFPTTIFWLLQPEGQDADWKIAQISPDVLEFIPANGPALRLNTVNWAVSVIPLAHATRIHRAKS